jgi:hypothetical protein
MRDNSGISLTKMPTITQQRYDFAKPDEASKSDWENAKREMIG